MRKNKSQNGLRIIAGLLALFLMVGLLSACNPSGIGKKAQVGSLISPLSGTDVNICAHIAGDWVVDAEATRESEGQRHKACITCGEWMVIESIPSLPLHVTEIIALLKPSVVRVICYSYDGETETASGSGFFIDDQGTFVTNAHVVKGCYYVKIQDYLGRTYEVDRMFAYEDSLSDHAVCRASEAKMTTPVNFAEEAQIGDAVYAIGYPDGKWSVSSGSIKDNQAVEGDQCYYASSAWIDHGSSGGVLVNDKGKVLGITTGKFSSGEYAALKYAEFKDDVTREHIDTKAPLDYFHTVLEYELDPLNMDEHFHFSIRAVSNDRTSVSYIVSVRLNSWYQDRNVVLDTMPNTITVKLTTKYEYDEISSNGTSHKIQTTSETVSLNFNSESELKNGKSISVGSSIHIPSEIRFSNMDISYTAEYASESAEKILIYIN